MAFSRNQRTIEDKIRNALDMDRARVQIGRISRFGLLEMSRQRLRSSLGESRHIRCPRCLGQGTIRSNESLALSIMRLLEEEAIKENTAQVRANLPVEIGTFLLNEKRQAIMDIEKRQQVAVIIVPNAHFMTPHYEVERIRASDVSEKTEKISSYTLAVKPEVELPPTSIQVMQKEHQEPAIKSITLEQPAPYSSSVTKGKTQVGLLKRVFLFLFKKQEKPAVAATSSLKEKKAYPYSHRHRGNKRPRHLQGKNRKPSHYHHGDRQQRNGNVPEDNYKKPNIASGESPHKPPVSGSEVSSSSSSSVVRSSPTENAIMVPPAAQLERTAPRKPVEGAANSSSVVSGGGEVVQKMTEFGTISPREGSPEKRQKHFNPQRRKRHGHRRSGGPKQSRVMEGEDVYGHKPIDKEKDR